MANYGIKIAKPGVNVGTAGLDNLVFHSKYPVLKIKESGVGTITYIHDSAGTEITVTSHNLGYTPLFRVQTQWYDVDVGTTQTTYRNAPLIDTLSDGAVYFDARPYTGTANLNYSISSFDGLGTRQVSLRYIYIVYYDPDDNP